MSEINELLEKLAQVDALRKKCEQKVRELESRIYELSDRKTGRHITDVFEYTITKSKTLKFIKDAEDVLEKYPGAVRIKYEPKAAYITKHKLNKLIEVKYGNPKIKIL